VARGLAGLCPAGARSTPGPGGESRRKAVPEDRLPAITISAADGSFRLSLPGGEVLVGWISGISVDMAILRLGGRLKLKSTGHWLV